MINIISITPLVLNINFYQDVWSYQQMYRMCAMSHCIHMYILICMCVYVYVYVYVCIAQFRTIGLHYVCLIMIMLPVPPSGRPGFGCWWWVVYWLLVGTAEMVAGIDEVVTDTLHGCWGSWIVSRDIAFWTVTMLLEAAIDGGGGGIGSVGRAAIATPACCDSWLFIDTGTTVVAADEHGNAEEDDNFETEDIGTINEFVDDVDVAPPCGPILAIAEVADVVE